MNNKNKLSYLFLSAIIALFIGYLLIENQDKIDKESYEKSIELVKQNADKMKNLKLKFIQMKL